MAEEFLPITVFRQREIDETRVEGMGNKDKPKWVLSGADLHEHAQSLIAGLSGAYEGVLHNEVLPYMTRTLSIGNDRLLESSLSTFDGRSAPASRKTAARPTC